MSQRISNLRDESEICELAVGKGLLVAVYVEALAAGQARDGSVYLCRCDRGDLTR